MNILIIDGQGGGIGKTLCEMLVPALPEAQITVVGTNALATAQMLKGGAHAGATGENALIYNCGCTDLIIGVLGIAFANSMYGEISPAMASAVGQSPAQKILIPISKCNASIAGVADKTLSGYIADAVALAVRIAQGV